MNREERGTMGVCLTRRQVIFSVALLLCCSGNLQVCDSAPVPAKPDFGDLKAQYGRLADLKDKATALQTVSTKSSEQHKALEQAVYEARQQYMNVEAAQDPAKELYAKMCSGVERISTLAKKAEADDQVPATFQQEVTDFNADFAKSESTTPPVEKQVTQSIQAVDLASETTQGVNENFSEVAQEFFAARKLVVDYLATLNAEISGAYPSIVKPTDIPALPEEESAEDLDPIFTAYGHSDVLHDTNYLSAFLFHQFLPAPVALELTEDLGPAGAKARGLPAEETAAIPL